MKALIGIAGFVCLTCTVQTGEGGTGEKTAGGRHNDPRSVFLSDIPDYPGNVILARPTDHSITANVMLNREVIHQLVGGLDKGGRGGVEAASLFEWGGHEKDGKDSFGDNRPGWEKPIHKLLVETGVSVVFHGHDHFFARQELDGIVYQLVPQPAHRNFKTQQAQEYGYLKGEFLPNSGFLSITVSSNSTIVEYVRTRQDSDLQTAKSGVVACRYAIAAKQMGEKP